jgi:hypothetical protein
MYGKANLNKIFIRWLENGANSAPTKTQASANETRGKETKRWLSFLK